MFSVLFAASWRRYLNTVSAAHPVQLPLLLLFLALSGYCVKPVWLHVYAVDVLVTNGVDGGGFR